MAIDPISIKNALVEKQKAYGTRVADIAKLAQTYNSATDPEIMRLRGNQAEKLKELFAYDQELANVKFQPQAAPTVGEEVAVQPEQRLIDPTIGMKSSSQRTRAIGEELADILKRVETRKDTLTMERAKALDMINALLDSNKQEQSALEKQMDWYFKEKDFELEERKLAKGTETDQERRKINELITDAQAGITLGQAIRKYRAWIDPQDIYETYNTSSKWGKVKATPEELASFGITTQAKKMSQTAVTHSEDVASAMNSIATAREIITRKPKALGLSKIPFGAGDVDAQILAQALNEAIDVFRRSRTGAAMTKDEIFEYDKYKPSIGDNSKTITYKLNALDNLYKRVYKRLTGEVYDTEIRRQDEDNISLGDWR